MDECFLSPQQVASLPRWNGSGAIRASPAARERGEKGNTAVVRTRHVYTYGSTSQLHKDLFQSTSLIW